MRVRRSSRDRSESREERKERTRRRLMEAALDLMGDERTFTALSLRRVARRAGISPNAFYRHFDDMEELGLELVDESFGSLHAMLRDSRSDPNLMTDAINRSVDTVVLATERNKLHFRFIARERYGGVRRIRKAIRRQLQLFADELAVDLAAFPVVSEWPVADRRILASLIAETMIHMTAELLDADATEADEIVERTRRQLLLVSLGTVAWQPEGSPADPRADRG